MATRRHDRDTPDETRLLAVAIGNTMTHLASMTDGQVRRKRAVRTPDGKALREAISDLRQDLPADAPTVVASVVPAALDRLRRLVAGVDAAPVLAVGQEVELPIELAVEHPERVGVDRVCCAAGAYARTSTACVVADFGTALTVDVVADDGVFMGGTILPGLQLSAQALAEHTAQLPLVEVGQPEQVCGTDTVGAIRAGIFFGMVGALREIVERFATQMGKWPTLIATGGDAQAIASAGSFVDVVAPDLIFDGIVFAYARYRRRCDPP